MKGAGAFMLADGDRRDPWRDERGVRTCRFGAIMKRGLVEFGAAMEVVLAAVCCRRPRREEGVCGVHGAGKVGGGSDRSCMVMTRSPHQAQWWQQEEEKGVQ